MSYTAGKHKMVWLRFSGHVCGTNELNVCTGTCSLLTGEL